MSDLFHDNVPDWFIIRAVTVMMAANWHTYQILTKRSERLRAMLGGPLRFASTTRHIWWGVSVEDVSYGKPRIDDLRETPAGVRFLSIEPLLEDLGNVNLKEIDWVIVGGESGRGARPMKEVWVQSLLAQCRNADIPFFFKQWGGIQKKKNGRHLSGRTYDEFPATHPAPFPTGSERQRIAANVLDAFQDEPNCDATIPTTNRFQLA